MQNATHICFETTGHAGLLSMRWLNVSPRPEEPPSGGISKGAPESGVKPCP